MNSYNGMMNNNNLMGMMNGMNTMPQQDYLSRMSVNSFPRYDIIKVKGQNGADAFQMAPNSKVLLLDENDPLVWFVQTDGAGYKTVTPYTITPFQPAPPVDLNSLEQRLAALEEKMYAKSYNGANKQRKSNNRNEQFDETSNTAG
jgi:hypothetical protein